MKSDNLLQFTEECEKVDEENKEICYKLKRHNFKMAYINTLGDLLQKFVTETSMSDVERASNSSHLSLDQITSDCIKKAGEMMQDDNILKSTIVFVNKKEKVVGKLKGNLAEKLNSICLVPIQRIRNYNQLEIYPQFKKFSELSAYIIRNKTLQHAIDQALPYNLDGITLEMRLAREILGQRLNVCATNIDELKYKIQPLVTNDYDERRSVVTIGGSSNFIEDRGSVMYLSSESKKSSIQTEDFRDQVYIPKIKQF